MADHCFVMMIDSGTAKGVSVAMYDFSELSELLPDARDGLNRKERVVLYCLMQTEKNSRIVMYLPLRCTSGFRNT